MKGLVQKIITIVSFYKEVKKKLIFNKKNLYKFYTSKVIENYTIVYTNVLFLKFLNEFKFD